MGDLFWAQLHCSITSDAVRQNSGFSYGWDPICILIKARENWQQSGIKNIYESYWHDVCVSQVMETEKEIVKLQKSVGERRQTAMIF